jgi:hypothetical protein
MNSDNPSPEQSKQSYDTPKLERYGNLRDLTRQVVNGTGMNDNQGGGNQKTG